jgi:hypothetical protein
VYFQREKINILLLKVNSQLIQSNYIGGTLYYFWGKMTFKAFVLINTQCQKMDSLYLGALSKYFSEYVLTVRHFSTENVNLYFLIQPESYLAYAIQSSHANLMFK